MSENFPPKPVVSFEEWSAIIGQTPEKFEGIDRETTSWCAHSFDGMITTPIVIIDGSTILCKSFRFNSLDDVQAKLVRIHAAGAKSYLLGVYPERRTIRMTCPDGIAQMWATGHIERLLKGETVEFRPRGNSMVGKISSGQLCTVEPIGDRPVTRGEIVLCKVGGKQYLHLVKAQQGDRFQIGNNKGGINGWITLSGIFGRCVDVRD